MKTITYDERLWDLTPVERVSTITTDGDANRPFGPPATWREPPLGTSTKNDANTQSVAAITFAHELAMGTYKPEEIEARAKEIARMAPLDSHMDTDKVDAEQAVNDVLAERKHQIAIGYDTDHDDEHVNDEIAAMATYYMMPPAVRDWPATETGYGKTLGEAIIPEGWSGSSHPNRRVELVRAVAMGLAEIERLDRAQQSGGKS